MASEATTKFTSDNLSFIMQIKVHIPAADHATFWTHFKPVFDKVAAEPDLRFFLIGQNQQEPDTISWVEGWSKDVEWFMNVQVTKKYYEPYFKATESLFTGPREVTILNPAEGYSFVKH